MTMRGFALRYPTPLFFLLYLIGILAPWLWLSHGSEVTLWLTGPAMLARAGWFDLAFATRVVTIIALSCLVSGAVLCLWSTAYRAGADERGIFLGMWFQALGASVLMPFSGSVFFLIASSAVTALSFLAVEPSRAAGTSPLPPQWALAFVRELFPVGFTVCFAVFAWRYNAHILIRCLLICFGISLVARGIPSQELARRPEAR